MELIEEMLACQACPLRQGCSQVVPPFGNLDAENPILMIIGDYPSSTDDEYGEPFSGESGQLLREVLRETKAINKKNTILTNILKCRPPKNRFPKNDFPSVCYTKWLSKEIEIFKPKRLLLLGAVPLKYVAGLDGITSIRGMWMNVNGIRTMATFHPSYIIRTDKEGMSVHRKTFERDIFDVAKEVRKLEESN